MKSSKIIINFLHITCLIILGCSSETNTILSTNIEFLSEDCITSPIKHSTTIPPNINSIKVTLLRDNKVILEQEIENKDTSTTAIIKNIEPYENYKLLVRAISKDNINWSGFADNVNIKPNSKTFVQINLAKERSLTCTDFLNHKRFMHSSEKLLDGRVLIFGGVNSATKGFSVYHLESTTKAEIFYPYKIENSDNVNPRVVAGSFYTITSQMASGRIGYIYEVLQDGKIVIIGGIDKADLIKNPDDFFICINDNTSFVTDIEIFDPANDTFTTIGKLNTPFAFAQSAIFGNKIYILGGITLGFNCNDPFSSTTGINRKIITIDLTNLKNPFITERNMDEIITFAGGKIKLSDSKYLFYGGGNEHGLILFDNGQINKVNFNVAPEIAPESPQKEYFPKAFKIGDNLYLNVTGYYRKNKTENISENFYIKYITDNNIRIEPDRKPQNFIFGTSEILIGNYIFQSGGIKEIPFVMSDLFLARRISQNDYKIVTKEELGLEKLKLERAFHSVVKIEDNIFLMTGGITFSNAQEALILGIAEIYNGYGVTTNQKN
ncbi:MAG: hypothetical protein N2746_10720 [Deltaproteobacteria bacterium]|nr:hypothetical protein [Deltaproteobacteria bacterium]